MATICDNRTMDPIIVQMDRMELYFVYKRWDCCYGAGIAINKEIHFSESSKPDGSISELFDLCCDCGMTNHRGNMARYSVPVCISPHDDTRVVVCLMCPFGYIQRQIENKRPPCNCRAWNEIVLIMSEYENCDHVEGDYALPAATIFHELRSSPNCHW